jgi:ribosome-binding factor A
MANPARVASFIHRELAGILHKKINDSRIGMITITEVKVSADLSHAWVRYSQIGNEEARYRTKKGLQSATQFIKGELGKALPTHRVPRLHFVYDDRIEKTSQLIDQINALSSS